MKEKDGVVKDRVVKGVVVEGVVDEVVDVMCSMEAGKYLMEKERCDAYPPDRVEEEHGRGEDGGSGRGRTNGEAVAVDTAGGRGGRG